jgi:hypothetical protein
MRARILSIVLSSLLVVGAGIVTATPAQAATGDAASVFTQTNAQRTKAGLKPLISDPILDRAAQAWANKLAKSCTFTHSTATWRADRVAKAGWSATGENIAAGYSASTVVTAWMGSAGHKANILNTKYTGMGVGYAKGTCYSTYWVQIFGWAKTAGAPGAGDADGDFDSDVLSRDAQGRLILHRGTGTGKWQSRSVIGTGWLPDDKLVTLGDFTGDSINDIGRVRQGYFELMRGTGGGSYAAPTSIGTGWGDYRLVVGGIDFDGDRYTDVLGVNPAGALILHRGNGKGGWTGGTSVVSTKFASATALFYAGDFTGDSFGDLIARRASGEALVHRTTGAGGFKSAVRLASGWEALVAVFSPGDFDGTGTSDIIAVRADGSVALARGNGEGGRYTSITIATGWNAYHGFG